MLDILQGSKYALISKSHKIFNKIFHDSVLNMPWILNVSWLYGICWGCTGFCVNCIHSILNALSSEYAKVLNVSEV